MQKHQKSAKASPYTLICRRNVWLLDVFGTSIDAYMAIFDANGVRGNVLRDGNHQLKSELDTSTIR